MHQYVFYPVLRAACHNRKLTHHLDAGYNRVNFGPRILRTETAGPAIITALQTLWGDMG